MPVTSYSRTPASNNSAPPNGAPEGWTPGSMNNTVRQVMSDILQEAGKNLAKVLSAVAGTNTITGGLSPALDGYSAGMLVVLTPAATNTGAVTLNIDALGALDVQNESGTPLNVGDLVVGIPALLLLDSGGDDFQLLNPQSNCQRIAIKTADETVNNSATVQDDDHLTIPNVAAGTYILDMLLVGNAGNATPLLKINLNFAGAFGTRSRAIGTLVSASGTQFGNFQDGALGGFNGDSASINWALTVTQIKITGVLVLTGSGTLKLQWAQNSAHVSDTKIFSGSYIKLQKIA